MLLCKNPAKTSPLACRLLERWTEELPNFWKVSPRGSKHAAPAPPQEATPSLIS